MDLCTMGALRVCLLWPLRTHSHPHHITSAASLAIYACLCICWPQQRQQQRQRRWWFYCYRLFIFDWRNCLNACLKIKAIIRLVCLLLLAVVGLPVDFNHSLIFYIYFVFVSHFALVTGQKKVVCRKKDRVEIRAKHLQYFRHYTLDLLS